MPLSGDERRRVEQTVAVRDTDRIPKVPGAGTVRAHAGRPVQVMHNGVLVDAGGYHGAWMSEVIEHLQGHHEPQEEAVFHDIVERLAAVSPAPVSLELGSFWAYYSAWVARTLPGARCVMVEPDPSNLQVGRSTFALNGLEGRFIQAAAGGRHGGRVGMATESDGRRRRVPAVSVDGLMADCGLERVDLLLCDVQGAEVRVLQGAADALRRRAIRFLVVSTHHHSITGDPLTHRRCLALLRHAGAHVIAEHSVAESCSGDGLIAVSLDPADRDLHTPLSVVRARESLFGEVEATLGGGLAGRVLARARQMARR